MNSEELMKLAASEYVEQEYKEEWMRWIKEKSWEGIAFRYFVGEGIKQDIKKAIQFQEEAIRQITNKSSIYQIVLRAYFELGNMYYVIKNYEKAKECYEKPFGFKKFSSNYQERPYEEECQKCLKQINNPKEISNGDSTARLYELALAGLSLPQLKLAIFYFNLSYRSKDLSQRSVRASFWFRQLAKKGDIKAQCYLGLCYLNYKESPNNAQEAYKWLKMAADKGDRDAQYFFASLLEYNYKALYPKEYGWLTKETEFKKNQWANFISFLQYYLKSAEHGNVMAINYLGSRYNDFQYQIELDSITYRGDQVLKQNKTVQRSTDQQSDNIKRSLEDAEQTKLKFFIQHKKEIEELVARAEKYTDEVYCYQRGAEQGDIDSQFSLLKLFYESKSYAKAKTLIKEILNNPECSKLNEWPYGGLGTPRLSELIGWIAYESNDYLTALSALNNAIETYKKDKTALDINKKTFAYLGNIYYYGKGVEPEKSKAIEYYKKVGYGSMGEYEVGVDAVNAWNIITKDNKNNKRKKDGCFITTAVCATLGKEDNCYELKLFRNFRDNWLRYQSDGEQLITEYYNIAPKIVNAINQQSNANKVYLIVWEQFLQSCVYLIENFKYEECKHLYIKMVRLLNDRYLQERGD